MRRFAGFMVAAAVLALAVGCGKKDSSSASGGGGGGDTGNTGGGSSGIEGTYTLTKMEMGGMDLLAMAGKAKGKTKEKEEDRTVKVTGDKIIMMKNGKEDPATYKLDSSKNPKEIELTDKNEAGGKEEKMYGIYKVEGDNLSICISDKAETRPKDFKTSKDDKSMTMLMVLQKKK
jgi:uncharacterized protein (TIGR03067 family)